MVTLNNSDKVSQINVAFLVTVIHFALQKYSIIF